MSRYAVIGKPVNHSKSPRIHSLFADQTGQDVTYEAIEVDEEQLPSFLETFFSGGGSGLNITVPYKEKVFVLSGQCTERAKRAKAVNTLYMNDENILCGDNTDGAGLLNDIKLNHRFEIIGKHILILGAGGAVRGALATLVGEQAASITIVNRTLAKAQQLQSEFGSMARVEAVEYQDLADKQFDLIINGTSLSLNNELPPITAAQIGPDCCCYDMMYGDTDTVFVSWCKKNGAALALDGLGMLVEQAAEAFEIWHGVRPNARSVIEECRGH